MTYDQEKYAIVRDFSNKDRTCNLIEEHQLVHKNFIKVFDETVDYLERTEDLTAGFLPFGCLTCSERKENEDVLIYWLAQGSSESRMTHVGFYHNSDKVDYDTVVDIMKRRCEQNNVEFKFPFPENKRVIELEIE